MQGDEVERFLGPSTRTRIEAMQLPIEAEGRAHDNVPSDAASTCGTDAVASCSALWRPLVVVVFSICVTVLCGSRDQWDLAMDPAPVVMLGLALGCFLAVRIRSGLTGYREASVHWSNLLTEARTLHRQALVHLAERERARDLARMLVRLADAVRLELSVTHRMVVRTPVEQGSDATSKVCPSGAARGLLESMAAWITERQIADGMAHDAAASMQQTLRRMGQARDACLRIVDQPRSMQQAAAYHLTIFLFCFSLPLGLVEDLGVFTPGVCTLVAYGFFCLENLAKVLENPFRATTGLDLKATCDELAAFHGERASHERSNS